MWLLYVQGTWLLHTGCVVATHRVRGCYTQGAWLLHTGCVVATHMVRGGYTQGAWLLHAGCVVATRRVRGCYTQGAWLLHAWCVVATRRVRGCGLQGTWLLHACRDNLIIQVAELALLAQLLPPCSPTMRNPAPDSSLKSCFSPIASASAAARRLRPLQLLLPGPIAASASTAAPRLRPLQLLLVPNRVRFTNIPLPSLTDTHTHTQTRKILMYWPIKFSSWGTIMVYHMRKLSHRK